VVITFCGWMDVGRRRALNEEAILSGDNLFIVCVGMGGHKAGEVASQLAIDVIAGFVARSGEDSDITWPYGFHRSVSFDGNRLLTAIKLANRAVFRKGGSSEEYTNMGTTVAAILVSRNRRQMAYALVGDSRIYLIRGGTILQLTRDDSWANLSWEQGNLEDTARASMKHVLTKAVGAREDVDFEVADQELSEGDVVLLCSDGLTNMLEDRRILEIVTAHGRDLEVACDALVAATNAEGGRDNISAILVRRTG
jgi:PPM family protein phosphatase